MAAFSFFVGIWVIASSINAYAQATTFANLISSVAYSAGVLLLTFLLYFSVIFPHPIIRIDKLHKLLIFIPALIFIFSSTTKSLEIKYFAQNNYTNEIEKGPLLIVYNNYLTLLYIISVISLYFQTKKSGTFLHSKPALVFWSVILGGLPAVIIDLIVVSYFPTININSLYAVLGTAFWLGITSYIILEK